MVGVALGGDEVGAGAVELVGVEGVPPVEPQLRTGGPGMVYGFPPMSGWPVDP